MDVFVPDDSDSIDGFTDGKLTGDNPPVYIDHVVVGNTGKEIHHVKYVRQISKDESVFIAGEDEIEPVLNAPNKLSPRKISVDS